jgi:hypothetical protein
MKADIHFSVREPDGKPRWNQPGVITELSTKYLKTPEGLVAGYVGIGRKLQRAAAMASDHGALPPSPTAIRDPKRQRVGSPEEKKSPPHPQQSSPMHEDRCCSCTKQSTCSTSRCECKIAVPPRNCSSCDCIGKCKNTLQRNPLKDTPTTPAPDFDKFPMLAGVLDLSLVAPVTTPTTQDSTPWNHPPSLSTTQSLLEHVIWIYHGCVSPLHVGNLLVNSLSRH